MDSQEAGEELTQLVLEVMVVQVLEHLVVLQVLLLVV
jgi:hypothetical protein